MKSVTSFHYFTIFSNTLGTRGDDDLVAFLWTHCVDSSNISYFSGIENMSDDDLARMNDYKNFQQKMAKDEAPDWEMFTPRKVYSCDKNSPEIGMLNPTKDGLNHVLGQTMSIINKEARKVLHRTLEFKRLNHGYKRYHPLYGMQYMLDLLMKVRNFIEI